MKSKLLWKRVLKPGLGILRLERPEGLEFRPGQFVNIIFEREGEIKARPYSITSTPEDKHLEFYVKTLEDGRVASHLLDMEEGDLLELKGPHGKFVLQESDRPAYMVCAGSGIAPVMSMVRTLMQRQGKKSRNRKVLLLSGASHEEELGYHEELKRIEEEQRRFTYHPTVSRPEKNPTWKGRTGRVEEYLSLLEDKNAEGYICGPPPMVIKITKDLLEMGFARERIFTERYY